MFSTPHHTIRAATSADAMELRRLAAAAGHDPLTRPVLVAVTRDDAGLIAAAVSLADLRTIHDDSVEARTYVVPALVMRARGENAAEATPSLRERPVAMLPWGRRTAEADAPSDEIAA